MINNGHIRTIQSALPTISVATQNGITAAAVSSGSTDTKGNITTTGDNNGTNSVITVTFYKTYQIAPIVIITAANAAGQEYTWYVTATTSDFTINLKDGGTNSAPSFNYHVLE